jgi:poly-gamma-glutamate synthesis protein (capsule biosynthesis protein)
MKKYLILLSFLLLFCSFLQNSSRNIVLLPEYEPVTLVFAGDIMGHSPQYKAAYNSKTDKFNYNPCFQYVRKYIESADLAICNLEVPIAGRPYSGYPNFSTPDALLDGLKNAGYDILLTANNHVIDRGKYGLERTIKEIEKRKLLHAGSYNDVYQRDSIYPLIVTVKGVKLAFLNYTYGTNANVLTPPNIVNYIDSQKIISDIQKADKLGADLKIMVMHWGTEYELQANSIQRGLAHFFVSQGINLIIGSHPHVVQDAEILYGKDSLAVPVYYSMGNSLSNQRKPNTDGGIMIKVEINPKTKKVSNTSFLPVYVYRGRLNNLYQYYLIPSTDFVQNPALYPINSGDSTSLTYFDKETRKRISNMKLFH